MEYFTINKRGDSADAKHITNKSKFYSQNKKIQFGLYSI